jgi:hypothetical protein
MKKEDFTPESIYDELFDYTFQHNYPDDEMNEIRGSHVSIEDIALIEIDSVKASGSDFIVDGSATPEVSTVLGEGDVFSDAYPMKFSYLFDSDGKIVKQLRREIDTSSFFAGSEDEYGDLVGATGSSQSQVFQDSMLDIQNHDHQEVFDGEEKVKSSPFHVVLPFYLELARLASCDDFGISNT